MGTRDHGRARIAGRIRLSLPGDDRQALGLELGLVPFGGVGSENAPGAFTTLWTAGQVARIRRAGIAGMPLSITFGGPHLSAPSFRRAGVRAGDNVFPVHVRGGRMLLLGRMQVAEILPVEDFVARHPARFDPLREHPAYQRLERHLDTEALRAFWLLRLWLAGQPEIDALCPGEADEVVLAADATPIRLDLKVPVEALAALRWRSPRRPERAIKHLSADGRIERTVSLQGIYRLTTAGGALLGALTDQAHGDRG